MLLLSGHFGFIVPIIILYNRAYAFSHNTALSVFNKLTLVLLVKIKFANKNNDCSSRKKAVSHLFIEQSIIGKRLWRLLFLQISPRPPAQKFLG